MTTKKTNVALEVFVALKNFETYQDYDDVGAFTNEHAVNGKPNPNTTQLPTNVKAKRCPKLQSL